MNPNENFSERELELINEVDLFKHKPTIMKKAESKLESLRHALIEELKVNPTPFPHETDLIKGQIARGENHKGFPFISLDLPQKFSKTEFFTFRTLFWWGHYLGFSLILKGDRLGEYTEQIIKNQNTPEFSTIYLAKNENLWEWEWTQNNFEKISKLKPDIISSLIKNITYIKLIDVITVSDPIFTKMDWSEKGLNSFRNLIKLVF